MHQRCFLSCWMIALLACLAVLPGCRNDGRRIPGLQPALPAIDTSPVVDGFDLVAAGRGKLHGQLALELSFSQPLASAQSFDALLPVTGRNGEVVAGSWVLDASSKTLRFPGVQADKTYTVNLSAELLAAAGSALGKDETRGIETGPLEPAAGFASQGSVLPAKGTRGLPVVSVNVAEIDVEFLRVRDSEVSRFFGNYQRGGRRGGWELDGNWGNDFTAIRDIATSVYLNRFVLGGAENERRVSFLPVQNIAELRAAGLYFALLRRTGVYSDAFDTAIFFVSDVGLHLRAYEDKALVHTASLQDGGPLADVELSVLDRNGETVLQAATDGNGNALFAYTLNAEHVLVAKRNRDVSMLALNQPALDLSEFKVAGREQAWFDVFAWSGRDLYRPGETVRLSGLMRDFDGRPVAPQPLFVSLKQPDGRILIESKLEPQALGYFEWSQPIPVQAPTGRWYVEFRTEPGKGKVVQGMTLRIEEFLPERMKLDIDSPQATLRPGEALELRISAAYLYGAPAAGNRVTARLSVLHDPHPVDALQDYHFGDPTVELPKAPQDVIDMLLGNDGNLTHVLKLPDDVKPTTTVSAVVAASVHESGGRPVTRSLKRTLWPAPQLIGVRPLFDASTGAPHQQNAGFEIVRADSVGKLHPISGLQVSLVREWRDGHWRFESGGWDYDYTPRYETIATRDLDLRAEGATRIAFPVEWGEYRLEVLDPQTGLTTRLGFYAGWSWNDQNRGLDARPDKVKLSLDKTGYHAGDTLELGVTPPQPGRGLLMVETGELLHIQNIVAKPGARFEIPVTEAWERHDVYITVLVFRGGSAAEKTTPARAVGIAHVPMQRRDRRVEVDVEAPAQARPEQPLAVRVSAPALAGTQAFVALSAVDLGILNITRFPAPDAAAHFFAQRRYGVEARDLYGRIIESLDGDAARMRFGGDIALEALVQARRPNVRVQTVDLFSGAVALDNKGSATIALDVPDFNGTLRVSAVVFGADRYGHDSVESVFRAPIVAEVSMPRALAPNDRSTLTIDVQNFTGKPGGFDVAVETEGPIAIPNAKRRLDLASEGKRVESFVLSGKAGSGVGVVRVHVQGNGLAVHRRFEVGVRPAWGGAVRSRAVALDPGTPLAFGTEVAANDMPATVHARLTVCAVPPIPFAQALEDLLGYPYGCIEQVTSTAYAALLLDDDTARHLGFSGLTAAERRQRLAVAFSRLAALQTSNGHFSFWGGNDAPLPLLTPYVSEFLLDAREAGFAVPENMIQKALERLNEDLLTGGLPFYGYEHAEHLRFAHQAASGYVLARVNRAPLGTLRALWDNESAKSLTVLPLLHLGLALQLQGDSGRADRAIAAALEKTTQRPRWLGDFGSALRDEALLLALLDKHDRRDPNVAARLLALSRGVQERVRAGPYWLSTQEQVALAKLGKGLTFDSERVFKGSLRIGSAQTALTPERVFVRNLNAADLSAGVRFVPESEAQVFAIIDVAGVPERAPEPNDRAISVIRRWYRPDGATWSGDRLQEGDLLVAMITVETRESMRDALVVDLLPSGLELENFNLSDPEQWARVTIDGIALSNRANAANLHHEEYRDDRYVAALELHAGSPARLFYLVRAVTPGTYVVPQPQVEDMYRPELRGIGRALPATITVAPR